MVPAARGLGLLSAQVGLATAAFFAGAAVYITAAEHPARLELDDRALLTQWKPSYKRGLAMQSTLAIVSGAAGLYIAWNTKDWRWCIPSTFILANWPWTLTFVMPVNKELLAIPNDQAGPVSRALLLQWGTLHAVRGALGLAATAAYFWLIVVTSSTK